ncbi:MAG: branched-chain amino acid ABC transporter permease [Gammaproteobacteria bacterium]
MSLDWPLLLVNALTLACIYGTLAIGISITWSSLGLINLAYGFIFALGGYAAWLVATHVHEHAAVVMAGGILGGALGGVVVALLAFIPIHDKPNFTMRGMIATVAISLIGTQGLLWYFGPRAKALPDIFGWGQFEFGALVITYNTAGSIGCSLVLLGVVLGWMKTSRRGLEIRAMMMNPHAASLVGIGVRRTGLYVMFLTGGLAGLAAVLLSQTYYVQPFAGFTPMIKGLAIALLGGLGSVRGAVAAAVILGLNEALTAATIGGQYVLMTQFGLIIVIIVLRPRGIAGILDRAREA